jgi:hypothetical protein
MTGEQAALYPQKVNKQKMLFKFSNAKKREIVNICFEIGFYCFIS